MKSDFFVFFIQFGKFEVFRKNNASIDKSDGAEVFASSFGSFNYPI